MKFPCKHRNGHKMKHIYTQQQAPCIKSYFSYEDEIQLQEQKKDNVGSIEHQ